MTRLARYLEIMAEVQREAEATRLDGSPLPLDDAIDWYVATAKAAQASGNTVYMIGNGGSAGIASHMAVDMAKNGGVRAMAFNDASYLTCLSNDLGYEEVFAAPMRWHGREGDLLVAISSSGGSANILAAVAAAREVGASVLTLSGFSPDNPLRRLGDVNIYLSSTEYGFVEVGHQTLLHAAQDFLMDWNGNR